MGLISLFYSLVVQSRILNRFLSLLGPLNLLYLIKTHNGETVTDDAGCTMHVTRWNGRAMAAFGPQNYSKIKGLAIRKGDVIICGYPKSGCHWTHEILYMLLNKAPKVTKHGKIFEGMIEAMPEIMLDSVPSPRVLNTHVFYHELPTGVEEHKNKIILNIRCPKDTVVSFYNHTNTLKSMYQYDGTFDNYFKMFTKGQLDFGCYFDFYKSWDKVMKAQGDQRQIYFLSFEDLKQDPVTKIKEIANFLGEPVSLEFAEQVAEVTSFSKLKDKRDGNKLFRKGIIGDWKNWLSEEQAQEVDTLWRENMEGFEMPPGSKTTYCA